MSDISSGGKGDDDDKDFDMLAEGGSECIFPPKRGNVFLIDTDT